MEAKDTVIKINEKNRRKTLQEKLLQQAEIAFKMGRIQGQKDTWDTAVKAAGEAGKQEGIREVVEWVDKHKAYSASVSGSEVELPFLHPADYEALYLALKQSKMPEEIKEWKQRLMP